MILVFGVVMNTIGDRVVMERANAYVRPAMKAGLMSGIVTLVKVCRPEAPREVDASSMDLSTC